MLAMAAQHVLEILESLMNQLVLQYQKMVEVSTIIIIIFRVYESVMFEY